MMVLWWRLNGTELLTPAYFGPVADTALFLAAVLLVAGVTYPLIEVRGREFLRRVLAPGRGA